MEMGGASPAPTSLVVSWDTWVGRRPTGLSLVPIPIQTGTGSSPYSVPGTSLDSLTVQ